MIEEKEEFTQIEKFRIESNLAKIKGYINDFMIPKMDDFFSNTGVDKESCKIQNIYYSGGTLCLDMVSDKYTGLLMLNISEETITIISDGKKTKGLMPIPTLLFAFNIYKEVKGYHLKYYRDCYKNSCIRHLYDLKMDKHVSAHISSLHEHITDFLFDSFPNFFSKELESEPLSSLFSNANEDK